MTLGVTCTDQHGFRISLGIGEVVWEGQAGA